ncbi:phage tail terminator protein [Turicimonas muris]|uniref:phage tail terminator protein n=3 Tax=Turicimonas muris TaxID=1796652 RepID=UPI00248BD9D8|nr:hypothetical protein [Turicimonas muris]
MNFDINRVIEHIRGTCSSFEGRVAGAVQYAENALKTEENPDYPCAYVVLDNETAEDNVGMNEYDQKVNLTFSVIVFVANAELGDRRGQLMNDQIALLRPEVFKSLLRYSPDKSLFTPFEFESGSVIYMDAVRMIYSFDFSTSYRLAYDDTWQKVEQSDLAQYKQAQVDLLVNQTDPVTGIYSVGDK